MNFTIRIFLSHGIFVILKKNMALFDEYKKHQDPFVRERANNWAIAIGLQCVDNRTVSDFLIQVARQEIEGKITMNEAQAIIDEHYAQKIN